MSALAYLLAAVILGLFNRAAGKDVVNTYVLSNPADTSEGLTVEVLTGADLAAAVAEALVDTAVIVNDVILHEEDWAPYTVPVQMTRNFTVRGAYAERESWPTLDFNFVRAKVLLAPGVALTLARIVVLRGRTYPTFQAPGLDLLARGNSINLSADNEESSIPKLVCTTFAMVFRVCLPSALNSASVVGLPRPRSIPGNNTQVRLPPWPNCINDTSARPMQRCWPAIGMQDVAFYALDLNQYGKSVPAGYIVRLDSVYFVCERIMTEQCITQLGTVGCYYSMTTAAPTGGNSTSPQPLSPLPPPPPLATASSSSGAGVHVAPLVGGLVIGGILLAVGIAAMVKEALNKYWRPFGGPQAPAGQHVSRYDDPSACADQPAAVAPARADEPAGVVVHVAKDGSSHDDRDPPTKSGTQSSLIDGDNTCDAAPHLELEPGTPRTRRRERNTSEPELLPVTPLTPMAADLNLQVQVSPVGRNGNGDTSMVELLKTTLGKGASGRVVLGRYQGQEVAVKLLDKGLLEAAGLLTTASLHTICNEAEARAAAGVAAICEAPLRSGETPGAALETRGSEWDAHTLAQEVAVLARCQHPNIIRLLAASLAPPRMCLVMERMDTSLERLLYERRQGGPAALLPLPTVLHIAMHVARALSYLHPTVLHRDLKPANVLISQPDNARPVVKLADFGLSRLHNTVLVTANPEVGTAPYMPPEAFDLNNVAITDRGDVYAFGVIVWEMVTGQRPWEGMSIVQVGFAVTVQQNRLAMHNLSQERCPPKLRALIRSCWDPVPQRRPAAAEIVKSLALLQEVMSRAGPSTP